MTYEKMENYYRHQGIPETPDEMTHAIIHCARQTGRTSVLIQHLPGNTKFALVTHSLSASENLIRQILKIRKDIKKKDIILVSYRNGKDDWTNQLRGFQFPIYFDNAVFDILISNFSKQINNIFGERN